MWGWVEDPCVWDGSSRSGRSNYPTDLLHKRDDETWKVLCTQAALPPRGPRVGRAGCGRRGGARCTHACLWYVAVRNCESNPTRNISPARKAETAFCGRTDSGYPLSHTTADDVGVAAMWGVADAR